MLNVRKEFKFLFEDKTPYITVVASRGMGKTVAAVQFMVNSIISGEQGCFAVFYSATLGQVKKTVEPVMTNIFADYPDGMWSYNASEHKYTFCAQFNRKDIPEEKKDKRYIYLLSYENAEFKRGLHPSVIVLDECASLPHSMFGKIILPSLRPDGRILAIGTVQGKNKFYELYKNGTDSRSPEWASYMLKASNTSIFDDIYLGKMKKNMTEAEYAQEFECDFNANVLVGAVFGEHINKFTKPMDNISDEYSYDPSFPVYTAWDLGKTNNTSIWFFQVSKGNVVTFIDFIEGSGKDISYWANQVLSMPYSYNYRTAILPHDAGHDNVRSMYTISETLDKYGIKNVVLPRSGLAEGVDKVKQLLKTCKFNRTKCTVGLEHLEMYRYEIDYKTGVQHQQPLHDVHSDAADAFRYAAMGEFVWLKRPVQNKEVQKYDYNMLDGGY